MNRSLLFLIGLIFSFGSLIAQEVTITEDPVITEMMDRFAADNKKRTTVEGWRIQILATTDRQKMERSKQNFQYRYPNIPVYWEHSKPYYKLRAGAFATKLEAIRLLYLLKEYYPSAYPAKDKKIRPEELAGYY